MPHGIPLGVLQQQQFGLGLAVLSVEFVELQAGGSGNPTERSQALTKGQVAANCVPFATYYYTDGGTTAPSEGVHSNSTRIYDNAGTATVSAICRWSGAGNGVTQYIFVVEFNPEVIKVQQLYGTIDNVTPVKNHTLPTPVASLNYAFGLAYWGWDASNSGGGWDSLLGISRLTSVSNFQIERQQADVQAEYYAYVIEDLTGGDYFEVHSVYWSPTYANDVTTDEEVLQSTTFAGVGNINQTMVMGGHKPVNDGSTTSHYSRSGCRLKSLNEVEFIYGSTSTTYSGPVHAYVVEWFDGTAVQRGTAEYTSTPSTPVITEVDLNRSIMLRGVYGGIAGVAVDGNVIQKSCVAAKFADSSTLNFYSGPGVASTRIWVPWEVVAFPTITPTPTVTPTQTITPTITPSASNTTFFSHTMTISADTTNFGDRVGYQFTVGASDIVCNTLSLQGPATYTQNVAVHRVSDGAIIAQADILGVGLSWVDVTVAEFTLVAGVSYTVSFFRGGNRPIARNQSGVVYYEGITKTANVYSVDGSLPTLTSANFYGQSRFGYV